MYQNKNSTSDSNQTKDSQHQRPLLIYDILFEIISFFNKEMCLVLAETSITFKHIIEKLAICSSIPRTIPYITIVPQKYHMLSSCFSSISVYKGGFIVGTKIISPLPLLPPPKEVIGFENITVRYSLTPSLPQDSISKIFTFFSNIKHFIKLNHYLHLHFEIHDYICSNIWGLDSTKYCISIPNTRMITQINEYSNFLKLLNIFDIETFSYARITSIRSLFFSYSSRSETFLSSLLDSPIMLKIKYLEIQNDIYCHYRIPYLLHLQITSICNWLFFAPHAKVLHFLNDYPVWNYICTAPIERFILTLIKLLIETARSQYYYLIIQPVCTHCFEFTKLFTHPLLKIYLRNVLHFSKTHIAIILYETDRFEIFYSYDHLYIRRSVLCGPIQKELDPTHCWNFFNNLRLKKPSLRINIAESLPQQNETSTICKYYEKINKLLIE